MEARALLRELKRTVDELSAFNEIGKALTSTLEVREVLRLIMEKVEALLGPSHFSLLLLDEEGRELRFEIAVGPGAERLAGRRFPVGEGIAGWVARTGEPVRVADAAADPRFAPRFDRESGFVTGPVLAVPLRARGRTLGLIELVRAPGEPVFAEDDLRTLGSIAGFAAIALDNARTYAKVEELTVLDEHTGLHNARHLHRTLDAELHRSRRFGHPFSLLFLDLDRFKDVNDAHGHLAGSAVLRAVGEVIRATLRRVDVPTRWGGDEFAVLLPETGKADALRAAERLRAALRAHPFLAGAARVTASIGVASFPDDAADADGLLRAADAAMYRVKATGRDAVAGA